MYLIHFYISFLAIKNAADTTYRNLFILVSLETVVLNTQCAMMYTALNTTIDNQF